MRSKTNTGRIMAAAGIAAVATLALAACTATADHGGDVTIRIAMGSSGDAVDSQFDVLKAQYEEMYPGRTVEIVVQEDDIYQTTGLATLLSSREAPDAYFEWSGPRMAQHVADGDGADIEAAMAEAPFSERFDESAFNNMDVDGSGIYMVPWTGDVTNVVWYNAAEFDALGLSVPTTWDEYLDVNQALLGLDVLLPFLAAFLDVGLQLSHLVPNRRCLFVVLAIHEVGLLDRELLDLLVVLG